MAELRLSIEGPDTDALSLWEWLRSDDALRGHVDRRAAPAPPGSMGALTEVVVALGSSGVAAAVASAVQTWLTQRHTDVRIVVTDPGGRTCELDAKRAKDADRLLTGFFTGTADGGTAGAGQR